MSKPKKYTQAQIELYRRTGRDFKGGSLRAGTANITRANPKTGGATNYPLEMITPFGEVITLDERRERERSAGDVTAEQARRDRQAQDERTEAAAARHRERQGKLVGGRVIV